MKTWLVSDTHFGHKNIVKVKNRDGKPLRPFATIEEHDTALIANWNMLVSPDDRVFHLGDVSLCSRDHFHVVMHQLYGRKILIKGNHDILKLQDYALHFEDSRSSHEIGDVLLAHIPIAEASLAPRWRGQIHGHLHSYHVGDPRYVNVSAEQTDFAPLLLEEALARFPKEQRQYVLSQENPG